MLLHAFNCMFIFDPRKLRRKLKKVYNYVILQLLFLNIYILAECEFTNDL